MRSSLTLSAAVLSVSVCLSHARSCTEAAFNRVCHKHLCAQTRFEERDKDGDESPTQAQQAASPYSGRQQGFGSWAPPKYQPALQVHFYLRSYLCHGESQGYLFDLLPPLRQQKVARTMLSMGT